METTVILLITIIALIAIYLLGKKEKQNKELSADYEQLKKDFQSLAEKKEQIDWLINQLSKKYDELYEEYEAKTKLLSRCIDRPRVNGKFVKKQVDNRKIVGYECKNDYNLGSQKLFKKGNYYNEDKTKQSTAGIWMKTGNGTSYLVRRIDFKPIYENF